MSTRCRRQERELRGWLYGDGPLGDDGTSVVAALQAAAADVEDTFGVRVELASSGDAPVDGALVLAAREAMTNAAKFAGVEEIDVFVDVTEGELAVFVRDRGVGLKPGEEKLVFNRFWRADQSRARQTGGTGLGLSISLEDARLHGGWLEAWGAPGQGAQFRLPLPARAGDRLTTSPLRLVPADAVVVAPGQPTTGPDPVAPAAGRLALEAGPVRDTGAPAEVPR